MTDELASATEIAGRELDALVAEHVMGLVRGADFGEVAAHQWVEYNDDYNGVMCARCNRAHEWLSARAAQETYPGPCNSRPPSYSGLIQLAWKVVEKMRPHSLHLWGPGALINDEFGTHAKSWTAQFVAWPERAPDGGIVGTNPPNWYGPEVEAETAPLAICRAALKAVGGGLS